MGWVVATRMWGVTPSCPLASGRGLRALREISSTGSFCANKQSSRQCWEVPEEVRFRTALGCPQLFAAVLSSIFRLRRCFSRVSFRSQSSSLFSTGRIRLGHPLCSGHPAWGSLLPGPEPLESCPFLPSAALWVPQLLIGIWEADSTLPLTSARCLLRCTPHA